MRNLKSLLILAVLGAATASCGNVVRSSRAPVLLVIDSLAGAGTPPGPPVESSLASVDACSGPCGDSGTVTLRVSLKDVGTGAVANAPSPNNDVTITGYRVSYRRTDGLNTQGIYVPYTFDGVVTGTIPATGTLTMNFELVRSIAKLQSPLLDVAKNRTVLAAIADVTFYGNDLVGNAVTATGSLQLEFRE
jgi:hypothetical protein